MFIIIVKGANVGTVFPLNRGGTTVIGRDRECDIKVLDPLVSRKHCNVQEESDGFFIEDLKSTNKTILNEKIIETKTKLSIDDIIVVGNTKLLFTDQKNVDIKSVEDYAKMRSTRTIIFDPPPSN